MVRGMSLVNRDRYLELVFNYSGLQLVFVMIKRTSENFRDQN